MSFGLISSVATPTPQCLPPSLFIASNHIPMLSSSLLELNSFCLLLENDVRYDINLGSKLLHEIAVYGNMSNIISSAFCVCVQKIDRLAC